MTHPAPNGPPRLAAPRLDLSYPRRIHVVGIGGPGMSAIAIVLKKTGHIVTGSELRQSHTTDALSQVGIPIFFYHDSSHITDAEIVTFSTAIPNDNVEIVAARSAGLTVLHRGDVLGSLCTQVRGIGVAGTHGKTTTSSLLMTILRASGTDVSYVIGAEVRDTGTGADVGQSDIMVVELDESDGTAEVVPVESVVITNIDIDHLDYFKTEDAILRTFASLAANASHSLVISADDANCQRVVATLQADVSVRNGQRILTFGFAPQADVQIVDYAENESGSLFDVAVGGERVSVSLPLRGRHNALNCAAAMAMARIYGVELSAAAQSVHSFGGVERRFEEKGELHGALLIDDYAHLPAEIEAVLQAAQIHPHRTGKVIAVFQPNRYHRVAEMAGDFADCFARAQVVIITDIYASGTEPIAGVTGKMVADAIVAAHPDALVVWAPSRTDVIDAVLAHLEAGDICISMGCGDIGNLPFEIFQRETQ